MKKLEKNIARKRNTYSYYFNIDIFWMPFFCRSKNLWFIWIANVTVSSLWIKSSLIFNFLSCFSRHYSLSRSFPSLLFVHSYTVLRELSNESNCKKWEARKMNHNGRLNCETWFPRGNEFVDLCFTFTFFYMGIVLSINRFPMFMSPIFGDLFFGEQFIEYGVFTNRCTVLNTLLR